MRIGGFQKNSMIDFPGKIAALLFTTGCNFRCPYCHNPSLIPMKGDSEIPEEEVLSFLAKRKGLLEGLAITGGEPTLQPDLIAFCRKVKAIGYPIKLDTNGTRPEVLAILIKENLIDCIAMDLKADPAAYPAAIAPRFDENALAASIELILQSGMDHEFRTTCVAPFVTPKAMQSVAQRVKGAKRYALQRFSDAMLYQPDFFAGQGRGLTEEEISEIHEILVPAVGTVVIR